MSNPRECHRFQVGEPSRNPEWTNNECRPFNSVSHVSHLDSALAIMKGRLIRAGLVFDESKLKTARILVSWTSPNYWTPGFRYGNTRFELPWGRLVSTKKFYWIEVIPYDTPACRILITDRDHSELAVYDPASRDGPWWFDANSGIHYYNGTTCLEFMFEGDLICDNHVRVSFVKHHESYCAVNSTRARDCSELGMTEIEARRRFLAGLLGRKIGVDPVWFSRETEPVPAEINGAWSDLLPWLSSEKLYGPYLGKLVGRSPEATATARAICNAYYLGIDDEARGLRGLFADQAAFEEGLGRLLAQHIGLSNWKALGQW